jgi:pyrimidine operon attenuation protein/uracil phosphoribosyltransferase
MAITQTSKLDINTLVNSVSHSILKDFPSLNNVVLVGMLPRGGIVAKRIAKELMQQTQVRVPVGQLESTLFRDDILDQSYVSIDKTDIPFSLKNKIVILVNDILFEGRGIRGALNGLTEFETPECIRLAVLLDRGHRKLPIYANYVGHTIETKHSDKVEIKFLEIDGEENILIL